MVLVRARRICELPLAHTTSIPVTLKRSSKAGNSGPCKDDLRIKLLQKNKSPDLVADGAGGSHASHSSARIGVRTIR